MSRSTENRLSMRLRRSGGSLYPRKVVLVVQATEERQSLFGGTLEGLP